MLTLNQLELAEELYTLHAKANCIIYNQPIFIKYEELKPIQKFVWMQMACDMKIKYQEEFDEKITDEHKT